MLTLMPVDFVNTVWIMLHQSAWTEQITLTCPCAEATPANTSPTVVSAALRTRSMPVMWFLSPLSLVPQPARSRGAGEASYPVRMNANNKKEPAMAQPQEDRPRRHFSMIREFHLADFFTLGNAACGVGAVFMAMLYLPASRPRISSWPRRWRRRRSSSTSSTAASRAGATSTSALGRELDSLADVDLVRRGPGGARLRRRHERRLGCADPDLFRLLRRVAAGALQRHGRDLVRRQRQGGATSKARRSRPAWC